MRAVRVLTNLPVADIEAAKGFYTGFLGLDTEEFNLGWVARYTSPTPGHSAMSVQTDDVDAAYAEAQRLGYEIVHPLTTEAWGVRRFFVRAPDGTVINVVAPRV